MIGQTTSLILTSLSNIYKVTIGQVPSCTCPDHRKGNECKHKVYVMHTVLKAPEYMQYQRALLCAELRELFENAPPIPNNRPSSDDTDGNRKAVDGECPICYMVRMNFAFCMPKRALDDQVP